MSKNSTPDVDFSFVRYANCWEDPNLLIKGMNLKVGDAVLSIASSGDNSLSLLTTGAEVIAVDLNATQIACIELRKIAIKALEYQDFLAFIGVTSSDCRIEIYQSFSKNLPEASKHYWDNHLEAIKSGIIFAGKFENYFKLFRTRIMPWIHRRSTIAQLFCDKNLEERKKFHNKRWNNWRWRLLFKIFFSRKLMGKLGRDPQFFKHVEGAVSERIFSRAEYAFTVLNPADNPYLSFILRGNFIDCLPHYLQPDNYAKIKANIDNLKIHQGSINEVAKSYGENYFSGFNLSDIYEYLTPEQTEQVYGDLLYSSKVGARFTYWNMLVPRTCPYSLANRVTLKETLSKELFDQDYAFFYSRFIVEEVL